jgi:hypothetical protein
LWRHAAWAPLHFTMEVRRSSIHLGGTWKHQNLYEAWSWGIRQLIIISRQWHETHWLLGNPVYAWWGFSGPKTQILWQFILC